MSNEGKRTKLENIAVNKVNETSVPRAFMPPNSENENIKNPKNSMIDEYSILCPVSSSAIIIDFLIFHFVIARSSLYFARK